MQDTSLSALALAGYPRSDPSSNLRRAILHGREPLRDTVVSSTEAYLINDLEGLAEDVARFHPNG